MIENLKSILSPINQRNIIPTLLLDILLVAISFSVAISVELRYYIPFSNQAFLYLLLPSIIFTIFSFSALGLYRDVLQYVTGKVLLKIGKGALLSSAFLFLINFFLFMNVSLILPLVYGVLVLLSLGVFRFVARQLFRIQNHSQKRPVIIYGAGDGGLQLLNSLFYGKEYLPVAFVDDDVRLQGLFVGGLEVSSPRNVPTIMKRTGARLLLLAVPSLSRARRQEIAKSMGDYHIQIQTIPGLSEIINGRAKITELRSLSADDLLGRDVIAPNKALMAKNLFSKVVMVTGAGGSIGGELCRQILEQQPAKIILFEISEFALYKIEDELKETVSRLGLTTLIYPILGSIQSVDRLEQVINCFGVNTIYHAAAYKHVPLVEDNVTEGVRNNVFGTFALVSVAKKLGVENFTLISTDKAVRPTNVMGATKRLSEMICQAHATEGCSTIFSMVRFGNVLGSSGSVIPRFQKQIDLGGPITVTHRDINRYFMTIPEAAQLVMQAGAMAKGGDVFVLDMGEPVKIMDLAIAMVKLHGLVPYEINDLDEVSPEKGDIPICIVGLRKGEKLYEELLIGNNPASTEHPRIMTASEVKLSMSELLTALEKLNLACDRNNVAEVISILRELPLGYVGPSIPPS